MLISYFSKLFFFCFEHKKTLNLDNKDNFQNAKIMLFMFSKTVIDNGF